jgi:hypothetical protein
VQEVTRASGLQIATSTAALVRAWKSHSLTMVKLERVHTSTGVNGSFREAESLPPTATMGAIQNEQVWPTGDRQLKRLMSKQWTYRLEPTTTWHNVDPEHKWAICGQLGALRSGAAAHRSRL